MQLAQRFLHLRRRLPGPVSDLRAARSPLRGRPHKRRRIHPQPLWVLLLPLRPSCRTPPAIRRRPALDVRTRGSTAGPRAARGVMRRGGVLCAQPQSLCCSSSSSGGALDSGVRRRA